MEKRSKYWYTMFNILDRQFPKGHCKERGQALVMLTYIEMMFNGFQFDETGTPIVEPIDKKIEIEDIKEKIKQDLLKIADAGEYEDLRREVENYFKKII